MVYAVRMNEPDLAKAAAAKKAAGRFIPKPVVEKEWGAEYPYFSTALNARRPRTKKS